jgi:hypothetical protein
VGLREVPHRGAHFELARQPVGSARPSAGPRLTRRANALGLSSRLFLLSAADALHALASKAFMRMLRREDVVARVPDCAGQRARQASLVVQVVGGTPSRIVHATSPCSTSMLRVCWMSSA